MLNQPLGTNPFSSGFGNIGAWGRFEQKLMDNQAQRDWYKTFNGQLGAMKRDEEKSPQDQYLTIYRKCAVLEEKIKKLEKRREEKKPPLVRVEEMILNSTKSDRVWLSVVGAFLGAFWFLGRLSVPFLTAYLVLKWGGFLS